MTEQLNGLNPLDALPAAAANQVSAQNIGHLAELASRLGSDFPEYRGLTAYGSTVRGAAHDQSDLDFVVFMEPPPDAERDSLLMEYEDRLPGTVMFVPPVSHEYQTRIKNDVRENGWPPAEVQVLPIDDRIVESCVGRALEGARVFDETGTGEAVAPRNIRCLFNAGIDVTGLEQYRDRVVRAFAASPHGATAWRMLRFMVGHFENGRGAQDNQEITHRYVPVTVEDAVEEYGITRQ